eukprot:SAG22_NODE_444_length_10453_cov_8.586343_1_plen_384_part_00
MPQCMCTRAMDAPPRTVTALSLSDDVDVDPARAGAGMQCTPGRVHVCRRRQKPPPLKQGPRPHRCTAAVTCPAHLNGNLPSRTTTKLPHMSCSTLSCALAAGLLVLAHSCQPAGAAQPREAPIAADVVVYLDSSPEHSWTATLPPGTTALCPLVMQCKDMNTTVAHPTELHIAATVPGDLVSDLQRAGAIGDPFKDSNWLNATAAALWGADGWVYATSFSTPPELAAGGLSLLVMDSVKMGARITLNGKSLGVARSQFTRYTFDISDKLLLAQSETDKTNQLTVTFDKTVDEYGRYATCAGGDDGVAPVSLASTVRWCSALSKTTATAAVMCPQANISAVVACSTRRHSIRTARCQGSTPAIPFRKGSSGRSISPTPRARRVC